MTASTSRPEGLVSASSTIKEANRKIVIGTDLVSGAPIYEEIPYLSGEPDFNNRADLVEDLRQNWDGTTQSLFLRGLEGGSGIIVEVVDADSVSGTREKKIRISTTGSAVGGETNTASNIGTGEGLFSAKVGVDLRFKSLLAGSGISLSSDALGVTINTTAEANTLKSDGAGVSLVGSKVGTELGVRSLVAGSGMNVAVVGDTVQITNTAPAITYSASTIGTGIGVYATTSGNTFQFRSLVAGTNASVTQVGDTISISVPNMGTVNTAANVGTGTALYRDKVGDTLNFRSLVAGDNVTVSAVGDTVQISVPTIGEANAGVNLGMPVDGEAVFAGMSGSNLSFRRLQAGPGISVTPSANSLSIQSTVAGVNLGSASPNTATLYGGETSGNLSFRRIRGAGSLTVTESTNEVVLTGVGENNHGVNLGSAGATVFAGMSGTDLTFRRLVQGSGVTLVETADAITIQATTTGEANSGVSLGGSAIYAGKSGVNLQFRGLTAGSSKLAITSTATDITLDVNEAAITLANTTGSLPVTRLVPGSNGQVLTVVGGVASWQNAQSATMGAIDDLSDVTITAPAAGQVLSWNGSAWVNTAPSATAGVSSVSSSNSAITVANGSGPNVALTFNESAIAVNHTQVTGLAANYAGINHTHDVVGPYTTASGSLTVNVGSGPTVMFSLPPGAQMAVVDYFITESGGVQAGTLTFVKTGAIAAQFTDVGTAGPSTAVFTINGSDTGINATAGAASAVIHWAMRAF